jgi:hypothetical protein
MSNRRSSRFFRALGLAPLLGFVACQQVLGLDQPTVSIDAIGRICECVPLTQQGTAFAGADDAACETALAEQPDELLLAVAENDCTDCANVASCYAQLTEAADAGEACSGSRDCASWACCQGVLSVQFVLDGAKPKPMLVSTPPEAVCCEREVGCQSCGDAFAALGPDNAVVACAESEAPLVAVLTCLSQYFLGCDCTGPQGVDQACLECLVNKPGAAECDDEYAACQADLARPIPVPQ